MCSILVVARVSKTSIAIAARVVREGQYIVENHATVRECAVHFGRPKTTVHNDLTFRLKSIDAKLYKQVKSVLKHNWADRHRRGGAGRGPKVKERKISL